MQSKGWSRYEHFVDQEKPLLGALPANFFNYRYRREFTVSSTYHVLINEDKHYYSVPYQYFGKKITVVYDCSMVEILFMCFLIFGVDSNLYFLQG